MDIKQSDWNNLLKDYNPVSDKFILDELLAKIPTHLHKKAYFELKTGEAYPTMAQLKKIVKELRFSVLNEIEGEAITFAKALIAKIDTVFRVIFEEKGLQYLADNFHYDIEYKDEKIFDDKERYLLNALKPSVKELFVNSDKFIEPFAKFYEEKKRAKAGLSYKPEVLAQLQNIKMIGSK
jgi:hypothetical protein